MRWQCLTAAALWFVSCPSAVRADATPAAKGEASKATAAEQRAAEAVVAQAVAFYRAEQYDAARDAYAKAYALVPSAQNLLELAMSEFKGGHPVEAGEHFRQYLDRHDAPTAVVTYVRSHWLADVEGAIAHLVITIPAGAELVIDGVAPSASVVSKTPDTSRQGETILSIDIRAGAHEVVAHKGPARQVRYVVAPGGQRLEIQLVALDRPSDPPPVVPPSVVLPAAPPQPKEDPQPLHRSSQPAPKVVAVIALGSAAVAAAVVAAAFQVAFDQNSSTIDHLSQALGPSGCVATPQPADCGTLHHAQTAERASAALANGFAIGAGALAVGALGTWFLWPSHDRPMSAGTAGAMHVLPVLGVGQAGLLLTRAW